MTIPTQRSVRFTGLLLVFALLVSAAGFTQTASPQLPKGVEKVTSVEGITEYSLSNGLRVLLFPDPSKPTVTVNVTYLVGSRHENYGETGMAHLLEHLLFMGSKNHPEILKEFADHGARRNGTTWLDRTNYYETVAATDENLDWALRMEADRMVNSFVSKKDLDSQMTVVRNEFEMGENSPQRTLLQRTVSAAYLWHNYGKSTIGARSDIENVPIERLQAFYRTYYQPDNAVLLVAGKIDEAKTLGLIAKYFLPIPKPARQLPKIYTSEPTQDGEREVTLRRVGDVQVLMTVHHIPSGSHPESAAVQILESVLADVPAGRLYKALVEAKKASSIGSFAFQLNEPGVALFAAEVRKDAPMAPAREAMLQTIEGIGASPVTKEEVDRARANLLKEIELSFNSSEGIGLAMSEWLAQGDWRLFFLNRDRLRNVTADEVNSVAAKYFKPSNRTLGAFIPTEKPDRAEIPPAPDVAAMLKDYKGDAAIAEGEAFDPSPANIESRIRRSQMSNGLQMILLPKKTRGASVVGSFTLRFGDEKSVFGRQIAGRLAASMLMRGSKKHTRQQIADELDRLKATVTISGDDTSATARIETIGENLPSVLELVAEIFREPAFPAEELETMRQQFLAAVEQQRSEPQPIAMTALIRHLNPYPKGDSRYVMTPDETIGQLNAIGIDAVRKFYADFYGGSNGELVLIGDFDDASVAVLAERLLGEWKSPRPFVRIPSVVHSVEAINTSLNTPDKANAFLGAGLNLSLRDDHADYPALLLGNYILGNSDNSRLRMRIRVREGLSYGVGSRISASSHDDSGSFASFAIYAPANVEKVESALKEEIARALNEGFTSEEVAAAKSGFLQGQQLTRARDASLASMLSSRTFASRTLAFDAELEKKISELTPEQIRDAMRRHIDSSKISIVKAGDFEKK
ncbi:MAG TPA: pitrilysin family protein [Thermoanaerobaculia bacterium]|nr:pitrilysin family protein [Thermoanaerobaculia bacterium]